MLSYWSIYCFNPLRRARLPSIYTYFYLKMEEAKIFLSDHFWLKIWVLEHIWRLAYLAGCQRYPASLSEVESVNILVGRDNNYSWSLYSLSALWSCLLYLILRLIFAFLFNKYLFEMAILGCPQESFIYLFSIPFFIYQF